MAWVPRLCHASAYAVALWAFLSIAATSGQSVTGSGASPVDRVVRLLQNLEAQLQQDGAKSDAIYDKYHAWCVESAKDLELTMSNDESDSARLQSLVTDEVIHARRENRGLVLATSELQHRKQALQQAAEIRRAEHQDYMRFEDSFERQRNELDAAANAFEEPTKAGQPLLMQIDVASTAAAVQRTLRMNAALSSSVSQDEKQVLDRLAYTPPASVTLRGVPSKSSLLQYGHARQAAAALTRGLIDKLRKDADAANKDEKQKQQAFEKLAHADGEELQNAKASLDTRKSTADGRQLIAGTWAAELNIAQSARPHSMSELRVLAGACKSHAHDQEARKSLQSSEIEVVRKAISLLSGIQEPIALQARVSMPRTRGSSYYAPFGAPTLLSSTLLPVQIAPSSASSSSFVFFQVAQGAHAAHFPYTPLSEAEIRASGQKLVAAMLQRAGRSGKAVGGYDPLAKVKEVVQKMLERLLMEAAQEMEHHAWCTSELSKQKMLREDAERIQREASRQIGSLEAVKQNIQDEVKQLMQDEAEVGRQVAQATGLRGYEKSQALLAINQYTDAKDLVKNSVEVLSSFYRQQEAAALPQQPREEDEYDGGMSAVVAGGDGPRTAAAAAIINLLQTAAADYERLGAAAAAEEKRSQSDYEAMELECEERHRLLKEGFEVRKKSMDVVSSSITRAYQDVETRKDELAKLKAYEDELKANCNQAESFEYDRRMEKEDEVRRLQAALKILKEQTPADE